MGAIAGGDICFLNENCIATLRIQPEIVAKIVARERRELERRERNFRAGPPANLRGRLDILVDDGLATGATMRACVLAARRRHPARIIVAVPVSARETYEDFQRLADEIVCVQTPSNFEGVGQWDQDFSQTSDEDVRSLLQQGAKLHPPVAPKTPAA